MGTEIILTSEVENLGAEGDVVQVKDGFARNFLIPRGLAMAATKPNLRRIESLKKKREEELASRLGGAQALANRLEKMTLTIEVPVGEDGKLFGSVTSSDIAAKLKEKGVEVERRKVALEHPIRETGTHEVEIKLHPAVIAKIKVTVSALGETAKKDKAPARKSSKRERTKE